MNKSLLKLGAAERINQESEDERAPIKKLRKEILKGNQEYDMLTNVFSPSLNMSTNPQFMTLVNNAPINKSSVSKRIMQNSVLQGADQSMDQSKIGQLLFNQSLISMDQSHMLNP